MLFGPSTVVDVNNDIAFTKANLLEEENFKSAYALAMPKAFGRSWHLQGVTPGAVALACCMVSCLPDCTTRSFSTMLSRLCVPWSQKGNSALMPSRD